MNITRKNFKELCNKYGLIYGEDNPEQFYGDLPDKFIVDEWQSLIVVEKYENEKGLTAEFWCEISFTFDVNESIYRINYSDCKPDTDYIKLEKDVNKMMTILNQLQFIHKMFDYERKKKTIEKDFE